MADSARRLAILHTTTRDAGVPMYAAVLDVPSGLSGLGRRLLHRRDRLAARERTECCALTSLVNLCRPLRTKDVEVFN